MRKQFWIKSAIKHPGILHKYAQAHHELTRSGTINKNYLKQLTHSQNRKIAKRAVLARTLASFHKHGTGRQLFHLSSNKPSLFVN